MGSEARVCSACRFPAPAEARFCSQCGARIDEEVAGTYAPRLFGVLPPGPIFVLACLLLVGGIIALVVGSAVTAIVSFAFAAAAFVLFFGAADRDAESPVAGHAASSGRRVRGWAAFLWQSFRAWVEAIRALAQLSTQSRSLRRERKRLVLELGDAAYREDDPLVGALRLRLHEIDEALAARERERSAAVAKARGRVQEEHAAVQPTQGFTVDDLTSGGAEKG